MKTKAKTFDCVEMMHQSAACIYEETKGMSVQEELAYWRQRHAQGQKKLNEGCSCSPQASSVILTLNRAYTAT